MLITLAVFFWILKSDTKCVDGSFSGFFKPDISFTPYPLPPFPYLKCPAYPIPK